MKHLKMVIEEILFLLYVSILYVGHVVQNVLLLL